MYLVYQPTGLAKIIGKRMTYGWYTGTESATLGEFFHELLTEYHKDQDDFIIVLESDTNWRVVEDKELPEGIKRFERVELSKVAP